MANNEISGISVLAYLSKWISSKKRKYNKLFDGYIGFFGYEILCDLIMFKRLKQPP